MRKYIMYLFLIVLGIVLSMLYIGNTDFSVANVGYKYPDYSQEHKIESFKVGNETIDIYPADIFEEILTSQKNNTKNILNLRDNFHKIKNKIKEDKKLAAIYDLTPKEKIDIKKKALWKIYFNSLYLTQAIDEMPKQDSVKTKLTESVYKIAIAKVNKEDMFLKIKESLDSTLSYPKFSHFIEEASKYAYVENIIEKYSHGTSVNEQNLEYILLGYLNYNNKTISKIKDIINNKPSHSCNAIRTEDDKYLIIYHERDLHEKKDISHTANGSYINYIYNYSLKESYAKGFIQIISTPSSLAECSMNPNAIFLSATADQIHEDMPPVFRYKDFFDFIVDMDLKHYNNKLEIALQHIPIIYATSIEAKKNGFCKSQMFKQKYQHYQTKFAVEKIKKSIETSKLMQKIKEKEESSIGKVYHVLQCSISSDYAYFWMLNSLYNRDLDSAKFIEYCIDSYSQSEKTEEFYHLDSLKDYIVLDKDITMNHNELEKNKIYILRKPGESKNMLIFIKDILQGPKKSNKDAIVADVIQSIIN